MLFGKAELIALTSVLSAEANLKNTASSIRPSRTLTRVWLAGLAGRIEIQDGRNAGLLEISPLGNKLFGA